MGFSLPLSRFVDSSFVYPSSCFSIVLSMSETMPLVSLGLKVFSWLISFVTVFVLSWLRLRERTPLVTPGGVSSRSNFYSCLVPLDLADFGLVAASICTLIFDELGDGKRFFGLQPTSTLMGLSIFKASGERGLIYS